MAKNKLRPVSLFFRIEQLGSHRTDFHEIWFMPIFLKYVEKKQVSLKSDENNEYFAWIPSCMYDNITLNFC
jgi:hypothetical protein